MSGLGKLKHNSIAVVGMAADYGHTVIVLHVQPEVFLINFRNLFHGDHPLAVYNGHMKGILYIIVDGSLGDLWGEPRNGGFEEIVVIDNQGQLIQIVDTLNIEKPGARVEACSGGKFGIHGQFRKLENPGSACLPVPQGRFPERLNAADGVGGLLYGAENAADSLALNGLDISVGNQAGNSPAHGVAGAVVNLDQGVLGGQHFLVLIGSVFNF